SRVRRFEHLHAGRQRDLAEMARVIDVEIADVDVDGRGDLVGAHAHRDGVLDDVDRTAALDAGRGFRAPHPHRDVDADGRAFAEPHEVDMHGRVLHRVELEVARDDAMLFAVELDVIDRGEEMAGIDALADFRMIERDADWGLVVAVNNARHAAGATLGPGGPLAALRACRRFQFPDGSHGLSLYCFCNKNSRLSGLFRRGMPPGVSEPHGNGRPYSGGQGMRQGRDLVPASLRLTLRYV